MKIVNPSRYALGLTRGSIRAILALLLVIATIAAVLATLSTPALPAGVALLGTLATSVVKDYFADRRTEPNEEQG